EIITFYGKGIKHGYFKMAQTGGSGGSIIPSSLQDTPMDFASFAKAGVALGSGALLICNDEVCVVDLARVLLNFFRKECCGKCSPCRVGTEKAYQILSAISQGRGKMEDLKTLEQISFQLNELSNCGLGQTAAVPLRDMLYRFRDEVEAHIRLNVCPAGACSLSIPALV
ncbi:MAG TPA: NADH-ubiquinone oxidoreductase-F iron-sulfur binding region domain-containing protein, partial [Anaerolineaceae bacterium]|nr:NADH-ubiquinone oxidoreductase-F iron-sulfur binding region domain-containing protein [Anaerolineaceae bacterium]